jgi:hypothetical protein
MVSDRGRTLLAALAAAALCLSPGAALADEPSSEDKETARTLLKEGDEKFAARDFAAALKAYQAAHAIMQVPTTGLPLAKAQIERGLLVEARDTLLQVSRHPKDPGEKPAFTQARDEATALADKVAQRIPSLIVTVEGLPPGAAAEVMVDGVALPTETLGTARKLNPGPHTVTASASGVEPLTRKITLQDSEQQRLVLAMKGGAAPAAITPESRFTIGLAAAPSMLLFLNGGPPQYGGSASFVFQVGLTPMFDLRTGVTAGFLHRGEDDSSQVHAVVPVMIRINLSPWFSAAAGLSAGFGTTFGPDQTGAAVGPEWTVLSMYAGEKRQYELSFTQGLRFGNSPAEYHQSVSFTYLFRN